MKRSNEKELALISGSLGQIYKDGIPIITALELVEEVVQSKKYKKSLAKVLLSVKQGKSLSESFAEFNDLYPKIFTGIISIGEETGRLYEVLKGLNVFYDKVLFVKNQIKNACSYPGFLLATMLIMGLFFVIKIIPNFCEIYKSMNIEFPTACKFLYDTNKSFESNPSAAMISLFCWMLAAGIFVWYMLKKITLSMFIKFNTVKLYVEYMMIMLFSLITSTGINISQALEYCESNINFIYLKSKIGEINEEIKKGRALTESMEKSQVFSKYTLAIVKIREEGGSLNEGFKELSYTLENNLQDKIKKTLKYINPILIFIMSGFVTAFILGVVLPLFDKLQTGIK